MNRTTHGILTTHSGALAHPLDLHEMIVAKEAGKPVDLEALDMAVQRAVTEVVKRQVEVGITVLNDGEESKPNYTNYIINRLNGFGGERIPSRSRSHEAQEFPEYFARRAGRTTSAGRVLACTGPVSWKDFAAVEKDVENLKAATKGVKAEDVFMSSASPGQICTRMPNKYYPTDEAYLNATADMMKREYDAIAKAGFLLQADCPELAMSRDNQFANLSIQEFRKVVTHHIEVLNQATKDISPDRMRIHVCWGRGEGPHTADVQLKDIADLLVKVRPAGIGIVGANGRHEHEWKVWKDVKLPDGKALIPGIVDNTTNIVEHPESVAERIVRYSSVVGRENVVAGVDCGFGASPTDQDCDPRVAWAKMRSLGEGAALATKELWRR